VPVLLIVRSSTGFKALVAGTSLPHTPNNPGDLNDRHFTVAVRALFLATWASILEGYDTYVIMPDDGAAWLSGRSDESVFDKLAFLSDHPKASLPFLSEFLETQLFSTFIEHEVRCQLSVLRGGLRELLCGWVAVGTDRLGA